VHKLAGLASLAILLASSGCGPSADNAAGNSGDGVTIDIPDAEPVRNTGGALEKPASAPPPSAREAAAAPSVPKPVTEEPVAAPRSTPKQESAPPKRPVTEERPEPARIANPVEDRAPPVEAPTRASLPLPNAVVSRTIERIGYPCGEVTSSSAIESSSGPAYKVVCSSGETYRASTVHGRLRFRRWEAR
jgi:outer membrane biosynthesis protein TonB